MEWAEILPLIRGLSFQNVGFRPYFTLTYRYQWFSPFISGLSVRYPAEFICGNSLLGQNFKGLKLSLHANFQQKRRWSFLRINYWNFSGHPIWEPFSKSGIRDWDLGSIFRIWDFFLANHGKSRKSKKIKSLLSSFSLSFVHQTFGLFFRFLLEFAFCEMFSNIVFLILMK